MNTRSGLLLGCWLLAAAAAAQDAGTHSLKPLPTEQWDRDKAAHLLARAGLGGTAQQIEKFHAMGLDEAVNTLVDYVDLPFEVSPPPIPEELGQPPDRALRRAMTDEERRRAEEERRKTERQAFEEIRLWWIERMVQSPRPFEEKMTLFWHGHFTSGMREVRNPVFMKEQNDFLRQHALGNFRELVLGISKDRAMLVYLDGNRNNKQRPNENYARELMELFTLGVGNYTETDIKEAARAFTGWQFDEDGFVFRGRNHDYGPKKFLGRSGKLNGEDVIDAILEHPACSKFIARNVIEFFCRPDPKKPLVDAFAAELRKQKFELRPAMKTLFRSQAFYHDDSRGCLVKSPVELLVGTARRLEIPIANLVAAERATAGMGQELMQPPNVKGWDGEQKWINTATLFQRYNTIGTLLNGGDGPARGRMARMARRAAASADDDDGNDEEAGMMAMSSSKVARSRLSGERQPEYDPLPAVRDFSLRTADDVVRFYERLLLPRPLSERKRGQLVAYLDGENSKFDPGAKGAAERVRTTVHLLCSTPEYQMN